MKPKTSILSVLTAFVVAVPFAAAWQQAPAVRHIQHRRLEIASGQYSGITHVQDDVYAVVHDKAKGGGIFFFTLGFNADGTIGNVTAFETDAGGPEGRDNEDIVYVPESGTLFVASEADQRIREYRMDGQESGRELQIPAYFRKTAANAGFEALAYRDGTFWTTTEQPLPGEERHRIQTFSLHDLAPGAQYFYEAEPPSVPEDDRKRAFAYAHGISALTALPDGRLLVLEREVYVPAGGLLEKLGSYTLTSLFLTDRPGKDGSRLGKTLLTRFYTSALNLSNFEGMCLGPVLPDGRQTLLLLADSQDNYLGLTGEYIRVLSLDIR